MTARRRLAERIGGYQLATTTAVGDASTVTSTDLSGGLDNNAWRGAWVLPTGGAQAGVLRRVGDEALSTSTGALGVTVAWPAAPGAAVEVELHRTLPPVTRDGVMGLRECLNAALAECWTFDRLALTGVNGQALYDLSTAYEWLDAEAINDLYGPPVDASVVAMPHPGWRPIQDANSLQLGVSPTLATGATANVEVFRPLDTYIRVGGVWGESTVGLQADADEHLMAPDALVQVALVHAYEALGTIGQAGERSYWLDRARQQRRAVNGWKRSALPRPTRALQHSVWGGRMVFDAKDFSTWPVG